jgi:hypothetical protein
VKQPGSKLLNFIRDRLAAADTLDDIRRTLRSHGVRDSDITLAIEMATHGTVAAQYPIPDTPKERRRIAAELVVLILFVLVALGLVAYFALKGAI